MVYPLRTSGPDSQAEHRLALPDKRRHRRFPLTLTVTFAVGQRESGEGQVLDISSGGVRFRCNTPLPVGSLVRLALHWPLLLNGNCPLKLCILGRVLRSDHNSTAVKLSRYEFRTARNGFARVAHSAA